jgi:hypothetical protein
LDLPAGERTITARIREGSREPGPLIASCVAEGVDIAAGTITRLTLTFEDADTCLIVAGDRAPGPAPTYALPNATVPDGCSFFGGPSDGDPILLFGDPEDTVLPEEHPETGVHVAWAITGDAVLEVYWPDGYVARFWPILEVLSPDGHVVARSGDDLHGRMRGHRYCRGDSYDTYVVPRGDLGG